MSSYREENGDSSEEWLAREGFDLSALDAPATPPQATQGSEFVPDLDSYDFVELAFSSGKDSEACLLHLLDLGVPREKITCHHHLVDGREGSTLFDWPCTHGYSEAVCNALGVKLLFSWREGGLEREMLREDAATAPVWIPTAEGGHRRLGGNGPLGTRLRFPQVSASLLTRWCSSSGKIDVFARYLCNEPRFLGRRTLVITGERAEESKARAHYDVFEPHRCDTRDSKRVPRHIDVWRAVHGWSERRVWNLLREKRLLPHPAYYLGWGRMSCRCCVFGGKNQWASVRAIAPGQFGQIAAYEQRFKVTIHRTKSVVELADAGTPYTFDPKWVAIANSREWNHPVFVDDWVLPQGAYGDSCGPT